MISYHTIHKATMAKLKIISGGQTGVDRAALDAALQTGNECGGWCPEGRLAEDETIPLLYPLLELKGAGYKERTFPKGIKKPVALLRLSRFLEFGGGGGN